MSNEYIKKFYNEVNDALEGNFKIILEPCRDLKEEWIEYDSVKWELEEPVKSLVEKLLKENKLTFEEKMLEVYKCICLHYIYDDNVLFFFRRDTSDPENIKYIAVDWYGRVVDESWKEKRQNHNRRICYEFSRFYAKAINELLGDNKNLEAFMLGDKENTHYVVGLAGKEYSAILDVDDFNKIKDLTRLKLGLTLTGITILRDETGKLKNAIEKFNEGRLNDLPEVEEVRKNLRGKDTIKYFDAVVNELKSYELDSQGFMEYMRTIVESEEIEIDKIWKEIKGGPEKRYVRCLVFNFEGKTYLLDSVDQTLNSVDLEKLDKSIFIFNPEEHEYPYFGG